MQKTSEPLHPDRENPRTFLPHHSELEILVNLMQIQVLHPPSVITLKLQKIWQLLNQKMSLTYTPYVKHQQDDNTSWPHQEIWHLFHKQLNNLIPGGLMLRLVMSNPGQINNIIPH